MPKSKKLKCDEGKKAKNGNFCILVAGKKNLNHGESCEKEGCCIGCDEVATCKYPCGVALEKAGIKRDSSKSPNLGDLESKKKDTSSETTDKSSQALKAHDIELMQRENRTEQLEGDSPYNKDVYVFECRFLMQRTAEAIIEIGKRLLVLKEKEGHGDFTKIVEEEIGIPYTSANRFMNVAIKTGKFPKIDFSQFGRISNVYSLLEAPEEELKELEEKGILAGYGVDELQAMSVKKMRDLIKKLKTETDKVVKEEVKGLEAEKKALIKENERLAAFDPEGRDIGWSEEQIKTVKLSLNGFNDTARRFVFDDRILEHPELQVKIEGIMAEAEASLNLLKENWENFVSED